MPSPVGHALGGLFVGLVLLPVDTAPAREGRLRSSDGGSAGEGRSFARAVAVVLSAATAPDVDFLWGRHNMETHSVGAAVMAGAFVLAVTRGRDPRLALAVTLACASHVLFDWLGSDTVPPLGVMALWPFTTAFSFGEAFVFAAIKRDGSLAEIVVLNALAVVREVAILGPLAAAAWWLRLGRRS